MTRSIEMASAWTVIAPPAPSSTTAALAMLGVLAV
jgi:hypothetical protein